MSTLPTTGPGSAPSARPNLAATQQRQRYDLAGELVGGSRIVVLTTRDQPVGEVRVAEQTTIAIAEFVAGHAPPHDAVFCLDGPGDTDPAVLLDALAARVREGALAVFALPAPVGHGLIDHLPDAIVVRQHVLESSWLAGPEEPDELHMAVPAVDDGGARWIVLIAGNIDPETVATACARVDPAAGPVHYEHHAALQAANEELRKANGRLAAGAAAAQTAAAAAVAGQIGTLKERVAWLEERLEIEIEVARRNDEYFQKARALLHTPRHRAVESLRYRLLKIPLAGRPARVLWRVVSRGR